MPKRRTRTLLIVFGAVLLLTILIVAALPLWLPWLLGPLSSRFGLEYEGYKRIGYGRFALVEIAFSQPGIDFRAERVEVFVPTVWLWRLYVDRSDDVHPYVQATNWVFEQTPAPEKQRKDSSPYEMLQKGESVLRDLEFWIPQARFESGRIQAAEQTVLIPNARWENGQLDAETSLPKLNQTAHVRADLEGGLPYQLEIAIPKLNFITTNRLYQTNATVALAGELLWLSNRVQIAADFGASDNLPQSARIEASSFSIPAERLKLQGYEQLTGSVLFEWRQGRFEFDLQAHAEPDPNATGQMPIDASLKAEGSTNTVVISKASITAPWLKTELSQSVELNFGGAQLLSTTAVFRVFADLSEQPWFKAEGELAGNAVIMPTTNRIPEVTFEIAGRDVGTPAITSKEVGVNGHLNWPELTLSSARVELPAGTVAEAKGVLDLDARSITNATLQLNGPISSNLLPARLRVQSVDLNVTASGPLTNLAHAGTVKISNLRARPSAFLRVQAEWNGQGIAKLDRVKAEVTAGESVLTISGAAGWDGTRAHAQISELQLVDQVVPILTLQDPFEFSLESNRGQGGTNWQVILKPVAWRGDTRNVSLAAGVRWPQEGSFTAEIANIRSGLFEDFFSKELPAVEVEQFQISSYWTNRPLTMQADALARYQPDEGPPYIGRLKAQATPEGLKVEELRLTTENTAVLTGEGLLPVTIEPAGGPNFLVLHTNQPLQFQFSSGPNEMFWDRIWKTTGIGLESPHIELQISGTIAAPRGKMTLQANQVRLDRFRKTEQELPPLQQVRAEIDIDPEAIEIKRLVFLVDGQEVETTARIPLNTNLTELNLEFPAAPTANPNRDLLNRNRNPNREDGEVLLAMVGPPPALLGTALAAPPSQEAAPGTNGFSWKNLLNIAALTGRVRMNDVDLAKVASFFPKLISPHGRMDLDLRVLPETQLGGHLVIRGAATRPLMPLGVIDDIDARLEFAGRRVEIDYLRGVLGGAPVAVTGQVDLAARTPEGLPLFNVKVTGRNVPLVRSPSLILRSDLDVTVASGTNGPPVVSGEVQLQKSYYLSDVRDLIPGGVATPDQRPPYFSINIEPMRSWRFDLRVRGDDFMNVRTALFRGVVSMNLKMEGTLLEPLALGDVTIDSGTILFPFANLRVRQGIVSLTSERPHRPELFVVAADRVFGYDIRIEVRGPPQEPIIEFTSTPPLSSEEIVLMLTAGQLPSKGPTLGSRQRATRLGLFLGKGLLSKMGAAEGSAERLTIRTGENISEQGKETYSAEYKLTEDWSIVGEYDRFNEFNLGLKWRIYSK